MTRISKWLQLSLFLLFLSALPSLAATPSTAPLKGDMAVSANVGFAYPLDGDFDGVEPVLNGTFEYYTTPRISWRGLIGITSFDVDAPGDASVDSTFFNANWVYNWERGKIHPFVTAGIGAYQQDPSADLPPDFDETVFGVNGGGGLDWFLGSRWGLKFEGTLHGLSGEDPNTVFMGTVGAIFWF
jgi:hypothetical protein